eukprot:TRINITY_DN7279_c0_g1_i1.p1 TRINITY_DN7279_c0_g1~~TRINITY_DN7279_c0_g1_i1.p1  ORF type:complete len:192 (+),score=31.53 TRINITY_DN7279_c0_g1_i1:319-894(+)
MIETAKELSTDDGIAWQVADLNTFNPTKQPDILYSNACLHWLDDHQKLFPSLFNLLQPGGQFAVQMPNNWDEPSHTTAFEILKGFPNGDELALSLRNHPVHSPQYYLELLNPIGSDVEVWETTYYHQLEGINPVPSFTKGSFLLPLLERLSAEELIKFEEEYSKRLEISYPSESNGYTLFPFRRLFIVAKK